MKPGLSVKAAAAALAAIVLCSFIAVIIGASADPADCRWSAAPVQTVSDFFDALCSGDMERAGTYVGNYAGLELSGDNLPETERMLYDRLLASYSYSLSGRLRPRQGSSSYIQTVSFTHLDMDAVSLRLAEQFPVSLESVTLGAEYDDIYEQDGTYSRTAADRALIHSIDAVFAGDTDYTVTEDIDVEVEYVSGEWKIILSDRLAKAIAGRTEGSAAGNMLP